MQTGLPIGYLAKNLTSIIDVRWSVWPPL